MPLPGITLANNRTWHDTVEYRFGINADTESDANLVARNAAEHAVDRDGQYIGGVIRAVSTTPIIPTELNEYTDCLMRPFSEPGIFYVSGVEYSTIAFADTARFDKQILEFRRRLEQQGCPSTSFTHPKVVNHHEPNVCRLACPTCGRWVEYDQRAFHYAFIDGLQAFPDLLSRVVSSRSVYVRFLSRHETCIIGDVAKLKYMHTDDDDFYTLDSTLCEDVDPGITN